MKTQASKEALFLYRLSQIYEIARKMILIIIVATIINSIFMLKKIFCKFLFSMTTPFYLANVDVFWNSCVEYDEEFNALPKLPEFPDFLFYVIVAVSAIILVTISVVCWKKSKNMNYGWLLGVLALYTFDFHSYIDMAGFDFNGTTVCHVVAFITLLIGIVSAIVHKKKSVSE